MTRSSGTHIACEEAYLEEKEAHEKTKRDLAMVRGRARTITEQCKTNIDGDMLVDPEDMGMLDRALSESADSEAWLKAKLAEAEIKIWQKLIEEAPDCGFDQCWSGNQCTACSEKSKFAVNLVAAKGCVGT